MTMYIFITYSLVVMVVILNKFSFKLARCMISFRDAGIKKLEPLCMAIINSIKWKKSRIYNFGNDFYF